MLTMGYSTLSTSTAFHDGSRLVKSARSITGTGNSRSMVGKGMRIESWHRRRRTVRSFNRSAEEAETGIT